MSSITLDSKSYEVISDKERINCEMAGTVTQQLRGYGFHPQDIGFSIIRNPDNDSFNFETSKPDQHIAQDGEKDLMKHFDHYKTFSVNNKVTQTTIEGLQTRVDENKIKGHWSLWDDEKFLKNSSWNLTWNEPDLLHHEQLGKANAVYSVFTKMYPVSNNYSLKENQILDLGVIKKVEFGMNNYTYPRLVWLETEKYKQLPLDKNLFKYTTSYLHFLVVPKKITFDNVTKNIADIYAYDESQINNVGTIKHEYNITNIETTSTTLKDKLTGKFFGDSPTNKQISIDNKSISAFKLGTIDLIDSTYYDYEKGQTLKGLAADSQVGELIPFNFYGSYTREMRMTLNEALKNLTISTSEENKTPLLDPDFGKIVLSIDEHPSDFKVLGINMNTMSLEDLQDFRETLTTRKYIPLDGIRRFSTYEENL